MTCRKPNQSAFQAVSPSGALNRKKANVDILLLAHLTSSYNDWKVIFDEDAEARKAIISGATLVAQADEKTAMIVFYGVDMEAMATFLGTPEFAERTAHLVSGHTVYSISELSRSPTFPLLTTKPACTAL